MSNRQGDFIWYELLTADADAAADFYGKVIGWSSSSAGQPDMDYRFFSSRPGGDPADGVGGYMALTAEMVEHGARPIWLGYIAVDDVDVAVQQISAAGGAVQMPPMDIDGVGRMAMVADPQGAPFYIMRGASDETSHSFAATEPKLGHCAWNELASDDPAEAKAFYGALFGWEQVGDLDMGPTGKYEFLWVSDKRFMLGAVMPKPPELPQPGWTYYFRVPDIDRAAGAIAQSGGSLLVEPVEIPGGDYSLTAIDPHGAIFGLVGARP
ncbi:VOC family protein [Altererythrobacter sp. H2]|uniref:VOC family protein n=1 Tax=Altererythrobacter sp. H2 TaxID=3108391 RepID=UPI002B4C0DD3|nr:VOC family protein [Altererythrobacter sp. H2]WRK97142.1 VOC family protein [Altererythrobacter sp. H2]